MLHVRWLGCRGECRKKIDAILIVGMNCDICVEACLCLTKIKKHLNIPKLSSLPLGHGKL